MLGVENEWNFINNAWRVQFTQQRSYRVYFVGDLETFSEIISCTIFVCVYLLLSCYDENINSASCWYEIKTFFFPCISCLMFTKVHTQKKVKLDWMRCSPCYFLICRRGVALESSTSSCGETGKSIWYDSNSQVTTDEKQSQVKSQWSWDVQNANWTFDSISSRWVKLSNEIRSNWEKKTLVGWKSN